MMALEYSPVNTKAAKEFMLSKLALSGLTLNDIDATPAEHPQ